MERAKNDVKNDVKSGWSYLRLLHGVEHGHGAVRSKQLALTALQLRPML